MRPLSVPTAEAISGQAIHPVASYLFPCYTPNDSAFLQKGGDLYGLLCLR
jgi:hypothetical protein